MSYQELALYYDKFMTDAPYGEWVAFMKEVFQKYQMSGHQIADLGCGTGEISWRIAAEDYHVTAIDNSQDMLAIASQKAVQQKLDIQFLFQDLRYLQGLKSMDAAISFCDVINYIIQPDDVKRVFQSIADSLKSGGLFIFDVHAMSHVENNLTDKTFALEEMDCSYIWFCSGGEHPGEMYHDLTFFVREENGLYRRFVESHHQQTHSIAFYESLLEQCNFKIKHICGDFSLDKPVTDETERVFFIAEKK